MDSEFLAKLAGVGWLFLLFIILFIRDAQFQLFLW